MQLRMIILARTFVEVTSFTSNEKLVRASAVFGGYIMRDSEVAGLVSDRKVILTLSVAVGNCLMARGPCVESSLDSTCFRRPARHVGYVSWPHRLFCHRFCGLIGLILHCSVD